MGPEGNAIGMEVKIRDQFVLTVFDKRVREFGLTAEEVDQYITLLRTAQRELRNKTRNADPLAKHSISSFPQTYRSSDPS
jgi:hypothetical protein